jgi:hypothetical protein
LTVEKKVSSPDSISPRGNLGFISQQTFWPLRMKQSIAQNKMFPLLLCLTGKIEVKCFEKKGDSNFSETLKINLFSLAPAAGESPRGLYFQQEN